MAELCVPKQAGSLDHKMTKKEGEEGRGGVLTGSHLVFKGFAQSLGIVGFLSHSGNSSVF